MGSVLEHPHETEVAISQADSSPAGDIEAVESASLMSQLEDDTNRCFLNLMSLKWRTVQELATICETPLSTTYRKINALEEAGVLERRIRINASGKHPDEYRAKPMVVTFKMGESTGLEVSVNTASASRWGSNAPSGR